ncbi:MAG TPA: TPM domain-containing protein [Flavobacteriales bacterium]|nr:TPM domain-containing protein [Flavobacteriales bacterium]
MRRLSLALFLFVALAGHAARFDCGLSRPPVSQQDRLVWQYADLLDPHEVQQLDAKLTRFARESSNRILVIVVDTLCGLPESDLAFDIGEKWGIGKAGFDNGIVFLIKPNGPPGQRKVFIATGYGLEAAIPDLRAKQVVQGYLIPNFKAGNYFLGIDKATDALMAMAQGEFNEPSPGQGKGIPWPVLVFVVIFVGAIFFSWRGRVRRYARTNSVDFWTAMWLLSEMDRKHRGRWNGGGWGGGGWSGGGGGGGFGGFGGGSFGGGGAGGSW